MRKLGIGRRFLVLPAAIVIVAILKLVLSAVGALDVHTRWVFAVFVFVLLLGLDIVAALSHSHWSYRATIPLLLLTFIAFMFMVTSCPHHIPFGWEM